jgi:hypothetical protein
LTDATAMAAAAPLPTMAHFFAVAERRETVERGPEARADAGSSVTVAAELRAPSGRQRARRRLFLLLLLLLLLFRGRQQSKAARRSRRLLGV